MISWHEITSVFLDMDGTLLDLHFDNHFWRELVPERYATQNGIPLGKAKSYLYDRFKMKEGTMDWYCVEYWSQELDLDITALKHEIDHLIAVHNHVTEFLLQVRSAGKRVVLVTNAHAKSLDLKMRVTGLADSFDALICAHDIGYPKEDRRFWSLLGRYETFDPAHTLFVDDSVTVLRAAREFGIGHIIGIRKPDSTSPSRDIEDFICIDGLDAIMPERKSADGLLPGA